MAQNTLGKLEFKMLSSERNLDSWKVKGPLPSSSRMLYLLLRQMGTLKTHLSIKRRRVFNVENGYLHAWLDMDDTF